MKVEHVSQTWPMVQLQDVCTFLSGGTPSKQKHEFWRGSIPWVSPKDMKYVRLSRDVADHISDLALEQGSSLAPAGSVFVVIRGMILARDVPVALAQVPMAFNQDMKAIVPGPRIDSDFLLYALAGSKQTLFQRVGRSAHGTMTLMSQDLAELVIPLPPIPEQYKIAGLLRMVQLATEKHERLLALTYESKASLLEQIFRKGLRGEEQKQTEIGPMPRSWSPVPLGHCCDIVNSALSYTDLMNAAPSSDADAVVVMGVKVSDMNLPGNETCFYSANLTKSIQAAFAHQKSLPPNTVVMPKRGAAIATNKKRLTTEWTVLDPNLIGIRPKKLVDTQYLFHWAHTLDLRKITDPGPTPQLNKKDLLPVLMPVPSELTEQREIADVFSTIDAKLKCLQKKKTVLTDLFHTLLHQLMTADIRVVNIDLPELATFAE